MDEQSSNQQQTSVYKSLLYIMVQVMVLILAIIYKINFLSRTLLALFITEIKFTLLKMIIYIKMKIHTYYYIIQPCV